MNCAACGYDLTAHSSGDRCPECGLDVDESERLLRERAAERSGTAFGIWCFVCFVAGAAFIYVYGVSSIIPPNTVDLMRDVIWFGVAPALLLSMVTAGVCRRSSLIWSTTYSWPAAFVGFTCLAVSPWMGRGAILFYAGCASVVIASFCGAWLGRHLLVRLQQS